MAVVPICTRFPVAQLDLFDSPGMSGTSPYGKDFGIRSLPALRYWPLARPPHFLAPTDRMRAPKDSISSGVETPAALAGFSESKLSNAQSAQAAPPIGKLT